MLKSPRYLGVDVSKDTLVVAFERHRREFANSKAGFTQLLAFIKKQEGVVQVACEATGPYHLPMCLALQDAGIAVTVCNPARIHYYGRSEGILAKSDPIDACLIEKFANDKRPPADPPICKDMMALNELIRHRHHLVHGLKTLRVHRQQVLDPKVRASIDRSIISQEKQIETVTRELRKRVEATPEWKKRAAVLMQAKGVGFLTAVVLLAKMPELGSLNRGQCAALAGLAPYDNDSGNAENKRCIHGGRQEVRDAIYMASVTAITHNSVLKAVYQRMIKARKPPKVALTAVMRKLLVYLNALMKGTQQSPA